MNEQEPSKRTEFDPSWTSWGLFLLGKAGLILSSFLILIVAVYYRSLNPWIPLLVLNALAISLLLILIAAHLDHDHHYRILFSHIAVIVAGFGSLGLLKFLTLVWGHRSLSQTEWLLAALAFVVSIFFGWWIASNQVKQYKKQLNPADVFAPANTQTTVERILKPFSSMYFTLGLAFGFIESLLVLLIIKAGNDLSLVSAILIAVPTPIIYFAICFFAINQKIIVGTDYLAHKRSIWLAEAVYFKDITKSREHAILAGRYPVPVLDVYTSDTKRPALRLPIGAFKPSDIKWLTSLPEMKFH